MSKEIPAQADVRTRGSVTTVKLTASGKLTIARTDALFDEILSNAAVPAPMRERAKSAKRAFDEFARDMVAISTTP